MLQLLQPIWLFAIAGIAVPVIIHLWNVKKGKTRKVGSIAFLTDNARSHAKSVRLSEWLLLLIRCLLLIILALLISKPVWQKQVDTKEKGWIVISQQSGRDVYERYKNLVDSLSKEGFSFHYFADGFEQTKPEDLLHENSSANKAGTGSYWTLLKEMNQRVPAGLPVYLFTDNKITRFSGNRPDVAMNIKWYTVTAKDTAATWIEKVFLTNTDSIRLITGKSNNTGTYYTAQNLGNTPENKKYNADTTTSVIYIYTNEFIADAKYVLAALNAIKNFTKQRVDIRIITDTGNIPAHYNWLFWLSENTPPVPVANGKVFAYAGGKTQNTHSVMITGSQINASLNEQLQVFKMKTGSVINNNSIVWKNGYGAILLDRESKGVYHFYSRFDPQWNDLVWASQFPRILYALCFNNDSETGTTHLADKRVVENAQVQPVVFSEAALLPKEALLQKVDLACYLWLAAILLFLFERIISYRKKKGGVYE